MLSAALVILIIWIRPIELIDDEEKERVMKGEETGETERI